MSAEKNPGAGDAGGKGEFRVNEFSDDASQPFLNRYSCSGCIFFGPDWRANGLGECRRRAPRVTRPPGGAAWPMVKAGGWCGEYQGRESRESRDE